jgi:hypothetical protein
MESIDTFKILLENGSLGVFALFLIYNYFKQMKRLDEMNKSYMDHIDKLREGFKIDVGEVRERYDRVIEKYDKEKDENRLLFSDIRSKLEKIDSDTDKMQSSLVKVYGVLKETRPK